VLLAPTKDGLAIAASSHRKHPPLTYFFVVIRCEL